VGPPAVLFVLEECLLGLVEGGVDHDLIVLSQLELHNGLPLQFQGSFSVVPLLELGDAADVHGDALLAPPLCLDLLLVPL